jgi:ADA HAT complex component 1
MSRQLAFNDDVNDRAGNSSIYLQIATPKSPNSDGFSSSHEPDVNPLEEEIRQKLVDEVDLEILLKHREYHLVQNEIHKVMAQLETMEKLHDDPKYSVYLQSLIDMKRQVQLEAEQQKRQQTIQQQEPTYNLRRSSKEHEPPVHRTSYGGIRPVVDANGNKICVHKRSDGVIVRVDCPKCGRTDFGSAQGFLNHARLAHAIEYKSQDHAALCCGTVLPDSEQDEIGVSSVKKLKEAGLNPDRTLAPGVCIEEQVKKKRRTSSKNEGYLEKLFTEKGGNGFKELVDDVTTKEEIDDDVIVESPCDESKEKKNLKKGHNRRKSRGGLGAVKFEDKVEVFKEVSPSDTTIPVSEPQDIPEQLISNQTTATTTVTEPHFSQAYEPYDELTPAQKRRVPTISEPLRTRSRSSRENSR